MVQARDEPGPQEMGPDLGDGGEMGLQEILAVPGGHQRLRGGQPQPAPIDPHLPLNPHQIIPVEDDAVQLPPPPTPLLPGIDQLHIARLPKSRPQASGDLWGEGQGLTVPALPPSPPPNPCKGGAVGAEGSDCSALIHLRDWGRGFEGGGKGFLPLAPSPKILYGRRTSTKASRRMRVRESSGVGRSPSMVRRGTSR